MTVESENKVCAIHKTSRMDLRCAKMTVKSESQACVESRVELRRAILTVESEGKVCGI